MEEEIIYTHILVKTDGTYLGSSRAISVNLAGTGMEWIKWDKTLPEDQNNLVYDPETETLNKRPQSELDAIQAIINNQAEIDALQDKVTQRLAGTVNSILKFLEATNTLTAGQQSFVDDYCEDYKAWIDKLEGTS